MTSSDLALLGIDPVTILYVYGWGFSMVLFGWLSGFGVSLAYGLIKRI